MDPSLILRSIALGDFGKGYTKLLQTLTTVGEIQEEDFNKRLVDLIKNPVYQIWVIEDMEKQRIIASGTLLVEEKFIHELGKVGHLEDIVVDSSYQGQRLGKRIIESLVKEAKKAGCYKVILDCSEDVSGFYHKCGFNKNGLLMRLDL